MAVLLIALAAGSVASSCSDTWDDHYDKAEVNGTESIYDMIDTNPQLSDFMSVLKRTHIYLNNRRTSVTYADLVKADQALTVWAPVNGTFNIDSLLNLCATEQGDSTVGNHFVMNHIAHNLYNMNQTTDERVKMLNDKFLHLTPTALYNAEVIPGQYNLPALNGLLHIVDDEAWYTYNIYEGVTSMDDFAHIGDFLKRYEKQELDEERSIQADVVDGMKVYSDSVMVIENNLFRVFDRIMSEDSTFAMLMPNRATWERVYAEAKQYFNFGSIEKADSVSDYWTNVALISDLIFNRNVQRSEPDSIFTTSYSPINWPYHVYYKPFTAGGYLDKSNIIDSLQCSNGYIYRINEWPFTPEDIYFHPIHVQGEREANLTNYKDCTLNYRHAIGDTISGNGYLDIVPRNSTSNWTATFEVRNTLSGTYDIFAVVLPKTVYQANSRDTKPNKFKATLTYVDEEGNQKTEKYNTEMTNSGVRVDSILIGRFTFPTCNYQQQEATVSLQLQCSITNRQTQYSREMFLDCIYLRPVVAAADGTKRRKEARK